MANNNSRHSGCNPPPKPWERVGSLSGPAPFKPSYPGSTSDVVEASGTARPGEIVPKNVASTSNTNALRRPVPTRPWMHQNTYGGAGYGTGGYGTHTYGGNYGSYCGMGSYNPGLYRGNTYGGMYNTRFSGPMSGGYGMGMGGPGGPYGGDQDPNNPFGAPSSPPGFWISLMRVMHGVVTFFGRIAMLIDQNTQAFHLFMTALLQLFDRSGLLYVELARFVFQILGVRKKPNKIQPTGPNGPQNYIDAPKGAPAGAWDGIWGNNAHK